MTIKKIKQKRRSRQNKAKVANLPEERERDWKKAEERARRDLSINAACIEQSGSRGTESSKPSTWRIGKGPGSYR